MNGKSKCKILKDIRKKIAEENDIVVYENLEFVVKEISKTRITKLKVNIIPPASIEETLTEE